MSASKIALLREILESAEANIRSAKQILSELSQNHGESQIASKAVNVANRSMNDQGAQIIEGIFDGQSMIGPDQRNFPVPANYASKSKIIPGDHLKLTILEDGTFLYKQIGPIERRKILGTLSYENGQYRVLAEGKAYKVILASVTYYKGEVGDKVSLIVPALEDSEWGAIDNIIPKDSLEDEEFESDY